MNITDSDTNTSKLATEEEREARRRHESAEVLCATEALLKALEPFGRDVQRKAFVCANSAASFGLCEPPPYRGFGF